MKNSEKRDSISFDKSELVNKFLSQIPNPNNYKILRYKEISNSLVIDIKYLDCDNYDGRKILVFDCTYNELIKQKVIDPHFSDNVDFHSPLVSFIPTEIGWTAAINLAELQFI